MTNVSSVPDVLRRTDEIVDGCIVAVMEYTTEELLEIADESDLRSDGKSWLAKMLREYVSVWR